MAQELQVRRNADGSLDIGHYRRRARRLRHLARKRAWRAVSSALAAAVATLGSLGARRAIRPHVAQARPRVSH